MEFLTMAPLIATGIESAGDVARRLADGFSVQTSGINPVTALLLLVAGILVQVVAYWIAAKIVVGNESGTLGRAVRLWFFNLIAAIGLVIVFAAGIVLAVASAQPLALPIAIGGCVLLSFVVALILPAKVFETDLAHSFAILVVAFLVVVAGQAGIDSALGHPVLERWQPLQQIASESSERRARRLRHLLDGSSVPLIDAQLDRLYLPAERTKPFSERQEELRPIAVKLEELRKGLKAGDQQGHAEYEALKRRLETAVQKIRAEFAASQQPSRAAAP